MKSRILAAILVAVASLFSANVVLADGGTLILGVETDQGRLDYSQNPSLAGTNTATLINEGLLIPDAKNQAAPALAESWDVSPDVKTYTFYLRKGVKFHDGSDFNAEVVKWNVERVMATEGALFGPIFGQLIDSMDTPDDHTIIFKLKVPSASFLGTFFDRYDNMFVIQAKSCFDADGKFIKPIGTGPFKFLEWKQNDSLTLVKNENYWNPELPKVDKLVLKVIVDPSSRLNALRSGDIHITRKLPIEAVETGMAKKPSGYRIATSVGQTITTNFNINYAPLKDVRVRQAFAHALNREDMNLAVSFGLGQATCQYYPKGMPWHFPEVKCLEYNPKKAKALLAEAGYAKGFDVTYTVAQNNQELVEAANVFQAMAAEIGVRVKIELLDEATAIGKAFSGDWQMESFGFGMFSDPDTLYLKAFYPGGIYFDATTGGNNIKAITAGLNAGGAEGDSAKRREIYKRITQDLVDHAPWIFMFNYPFSYGISDKVKNYKPLANDWYYAGGGIPYATLD
jgi:peptide/nickel transport system substrate-binding protein